MAEALSWHSSGAVSSAATGGVGELASGELAMGLRARSRVTRSAQAAGVAEGPPASSQGVVRGGGISDGGIAVIGSVSEAASGVYGAWRRREDISASGRSGDGPTGRSPR